MRNILVDLSSDRQDAVHLFGGFEGEHNATTLSVILPERMKNQSDGEYRFVFETVKKEVIFSAPMEPEDGVLSVSLVKNLTLAPSLTVYVGCYRYEDGAPVQIFKSGQIVLGIKNPEEGEVVEWNGEGGCVPGIVMEDSVLPDSKNPVKSRVLYTALEEKIPFSHITDKVSDISKAGEKIPTEKAVAKRLEDFVPKETFAEEVLAVGNEAYTYREEFSDLKNRAASAVSTSKKGNPIRLDDISPIEHSLSVSLLPAGASVTRFGKNLIPYPFSGVEKNSAVSFCGVTVSDGGNGTVTVSGTCTEICRLEICSAGALKQLVHGASYTLYGGEINSGYCLYLSYTDEEGNENSVSAGNSVVWREAFRLNGIYIQFESGYAFSQEKISPMIELGNKVSGYEAPISPETLASDSDGLIYGMTSLFPTTTLVASQGTAITAEYHQDTDKVVKKTVTAASVDADGDLIVTLADGTKSNAGHVVGPKGDQGVQGDKGEQGIQGEKGEKGDKGDSADDLSLLANALKGNASGNPLRLDDVLPFEHEMKVSVDGKDPELIARGDIVKTDVTEEGLYTISGFEEFHDDIGNLYCKILFNNGKHYSVSVWDCIPFFDTCEEFIESAGLKVGDVVFVGWEVVVDSADGGWFNLYSPVTVKKYGKNLLPVRRELSLPTDNNFSVDCNIPAPFVFSMTFNITASATAAGGAVFQLTYDDGTVSSIAASSWNFQSLTGIITKNLAINNGKTLVKVSFPNWAKLTATIYDMQIEAGTVATEYEPYVETITYTTGENGRVSIPSLYPTTTLLADSGATITAEYNIDTKKYIDKKIAELQALVLEV